MRTLTQHLVQYADYHRDARNVATHCVGVPLIVVAVEALLARVGVHVGADVGAHWLSLALVATVAAVVFYFTLDRFFGVVMAIVLGLCLTIGSWAASQSTATWLVVGVGGFVVGWVVQFVGHHFEGRKPAFVDDLIGLVIGPLFVVAEAVFALGLRPALARAVQAGAPRGARPAALDARH